MSNGIPQGIEMLHLHQLSVGYIDHTLFEGLNLSLRSGQLVCFMGPNGAGKSTLIRTIGGLQQPRAGAVVVQGSNTSQSNPEKIALVLTDPVKDINITVEEMVSFGRYPFLKWTVTLSSRDEEIIASAIDRVNIGHLRKKRLYQLSDGQIQMTMIARALAQDTPLIILDEPTAHLDLNNRVEIMRLLEGLAHREGKCILMATHELDLALQTSDLIWLTGNERNIITGIPEDLVLDGSFDETFRFKGFDLKTGKVQHHPYRGRCIRLTGEGYAYLWTRNALERNGFDVSDDSGDIHVVVTRKNDRFVWDIGGNQTVFSPGALLDVLLAQRVSPE